ncbi:cytochrome P450 monooxygenase [Halenospora varia]|nr:cytochrome P450 monooxygenase [Halenospora varia]
MFVVNALFSPLSIASFFLLCLFFALNNIAQHYLRVRNLKRQRIDVPCLNLEGEDFEGARQRYMSDLHGLLQLGYQKFKHGIYQLWSIHGFVTIVSPDFLEELSALPTNTLDFYEATQKRMVGDFEWVTLGDHLEAHTILTDLTQQTGKLLPDLGREIEHAIKTELLDCKEWTPVTVFPKILRIVALVTGRAFVGPEMNRNEEWLHASTSFMMDVYMGGVKLRSYSHFMRPFAARFLVTEIRRVWKHQATARRLLVPIMMSRSRAQMLEEDYEKPNDMIQWLMDNNAKQENPRPFARLAELHLLVCFAALHTSTLGLTHMIFDIAARPEYMTPLRTEISEAINAYGSLHTKPTFNSMIKMDSFMKESQRLNPPSLLTYSRLVMKEVTLKNGTILTPGTYVLCPAGLVSLDPEIWESPMEFRGFRFSDLRSAKKEDAHKYQFATVTPRAVHFGYGRQACPGRFFASYEIKSIMASILSNFDLRVVDEKVGRPKNICSGAMVAPDEKAQIMFIRREFS